MTEGRGARGVLVLAVGNPILGDDGAGPRALALLESEGGLPDGVALMDGGTEGLTLLPALEDAARLLILDALDAGLAPGALARMSGDEVPTALRRRLSPHEVGLADLLALARLRGTLPLEVVLLGVQPGALAVSTELTPPVAAALPALVRAAREEVRRLAGEGAAPLAGTAAIEEPRSVVC
jgi:hydrogenase maturation protease